MGQWAACAAEFGAYNTKEIPDCFRHTGDEKEEIFMKQRNKRQLLAAMAAMAILVPVGGGIARIRADEYFAY